MQRLIPLFVILGVCSGSQLTLLPYAYLADPLPVYHQSQDTRTGEHAYSYAGGPSAKEEVRGPDGVTRGSYSYVDAHGILQSVFYVADEGGFRVAATNLPTDQNLPLEPAEILLARNASPVEHTSRRKRSLDETVKSTNEQEQKESASPKEADQQPSESVQSVVYQLPESVLLPKLVTATSHQSQVQIHKNVKLEQEQPATLVNVQAEPAYQSVLLPAAEVPLATSHQSQVQVHRNVNVKLSEPEGVVKAKEPVVLDTPLTPIVETVPLLATVPSYHENRIQLHKDIGLEGPNPKDTVKITEQPVSIVEAPLTTVRYLPSVYTRQTVPVFPTVFRQAYPLVQPVNKIGTASVTTSVSSHGISQIHGDSNVKYAAPFVTEPALYFRTGLPYFHTIPYAAAAQARVQIHSN